MFIQLCIPCYIRITGNDVFLFYGLLINIHDIWDTYLLITRNVMDDAWIYILLHSFGTWRILVIHGFRCTNNNYSVYTLSVLTTWDANFNVFILRRYEKRSSEWRVRYIVEHLAEPINRRRRQFPNGTSPVRHTCAVLVKPNLCVYVQHV